MACACVSWTRPLPALSVVILMCNPCVSPERPQRSQGLHSASGDHTGTGSRQRRHSFLAQGTRCHTSVCVRLALSSTLLVSSITCINWALAVRRNSLLATQLSCCNPDCSRQHITLGQSSHVQGCTLCTPARSAFSLCSWQGHTAWRYHSASHDTAHSTQISSVSAVLGHLLSHRHHHHHHRLLLYAVVTHEHDTPNLRVAASLVLRVPSHTHARWLPRCCPKQPWGAHHLHCTQPECARGTQTRVCAPTG